MRNMMLFKFSKIYSAAVKYITVDERNVKGSISCNHFANKSFVVASVINAIVDRSLSSLPNGDTPEVRVNRRKAFEF